MRSCEVQLQGCPYEAQNDELENFPQIHADVSERQYSMSVRHHLNDFFDGAVGMGNWEKKYSF